MNVTRFEVVGRGAFPLDMLRHDCVFPAGPEDAASIGFALDHQARRDHRIRNGQGATFRIQLIRYHSQHYWEPTEGRWLSFGWSVVKDSVRTTRPPRGELG